MDIPSPLSSRPARIAGAVSGLVAAIVALGIAELVAGTRGSWRSPVFDVGDRVVDNVPSWLKDLAIEWFGTNDKQVLVGSILAILGVYAMVIGALAFTRRFAIGIGLFGLVGMFMAFTRNVGGGVLAMVPTVIGVAAGRGALLAAFRVSLPGLTFDPDTDPDDADVDADGGGPGDTTRREALVKSGAVLDGMAGVGAGAVGRAIRPSAAASRRTDGYTLTVKGTVDRELQNSYEDLINRAVVEYDITTTCVSNVVGGELVDNARWLGVRLDTLLDEADIQSSANQVVGRSIDGLGRLDIDENGMAAVGGVTCSQTRGISAVEVSLDDGEWQPAELGEALNDDTWRQWAFRFRVPDLDASRVSIKCRAIDDDGMIQEEEQHQDEGRSGHHRTHRRSVRQ